MNIITLAIGMCACLLIACASEGNRPPSNPGERPQCEIERRRRQRDDVGSSDVPDGEENAGV